MRFMGVLLLIVGAIVIIYALSMDVSVLTSYGNRVNNIGLMAARQNSTLVGGIIIVCGLLMTLFGKGAQRAANNEVKCPYCAELINKEAIKCKHCGSDVSDAMSNLKDMPFKVSDFDYMRTFRKMNTGFIISDPDVRELVEKMKQSAKSSHPMNVYDEFSDDIDEMKNLLPSDVRDEFVKRIKYFLGK